MAPGGRACLRGMVRERRRWGLLLLGLLLAGCGSSEPAARCSPADLEVQHLTLGGMEREFAVHVPAGIDPTRAVPLLVDLHGLGTWCHQAGITGSLDLANRENLVVVYPRGIDDQWNAWEMPDLADDVTFLRELVAKLVRELPVATDRIYLLGYSNGAAMAYLLGCRAADLFAALGAVAGTLSIPPLECRPSRPLPVMHFHGTADTNWPYDGSFGLIGAPLNAWDWTDRDRCAWPSVETFRQDPGRCETWRGCDAGVEVTLCTIQGMGHCWPGTVCGTAGAPETSGVPATDLLWRFFQRFWLPSGGP